MPYCAECGTEHEADAMFCPSCGHTIDAEDPTPVEPSEPTASTREAGGADGYSTGQKALFAGAAIAAIGALLPWVTISVLGTTASMNGIEGDGVFTLVLALLAGGIGLVRWGRVAKTSVGVIGVLVLLVGFYYISDPLTGAEFTSSQSEQIARNAARPGIGLYMTAAGGLAILAGAVADSVR